MMPAARPAGTVTTPVVAGDMAVVTRGLTKRYGDRVAVAGLDLNVPRGQVYGFLGPNGSGKTTTLRMLVGLIRPNAGEIAVLGQPYSWRDRRRMFRIGAMIETPAFYPYLSGRDNLRVFAATGAPTPISRVDEVLEAVGLTDRGSDKVRTYSLGMRQRLGIAVALVSDPDLLLLDEPANGLDPAGIVAMRELLRYLTDRGKTVLVSSHILPEVQQLADIVGIIDRGRLVREGPMAELLAGGARVRMLVRPDEVAAGPGCPGRCRRARGAGDQQTERRPAGSLVRVASDQAARCNQLLAQQGIFASAIDATSDLESVFLSLTAGAGMDVDSATSSGPPAGWGESG